MTPLEKKQEELTRVQNKFIDRLYQAFKYQSEDLLIEFYTVNKEFEDKIEKITLELSELKEEKPEPVKSATPYKWTRFGMESDIKGQWILKSDTVQSQFTQPEGKKENAIYPLCGYDKFEIYSENSDANCFMNRTGFSYKRLQNNPSICNGCVYNNSIK